MLRNKAILVVDDGESDRIRMVERMPDRPPSSGCRQQEQLRSCWRSTQSHFCLENDEAAIPALVSHVQQQARSMRSLDEAATFQLGVALHEALRNAVEHGNLELSSSSLYRDDEDPSAYSHLAEARRRQEPYCRRRVHVTVYESPAGGRYTIRDEGSGFDKRLLAYDPSAPENIERRSGRGLSLIQAFMDEVAFNERGNEITMTHRSRPENGTESAGVDGEGRQNRTSP